MVRCAQCGSEFVPKRKNSRCCSARCSKRIGRDNANRECEEEGCVRPVRAQGLCATHYNQRRPGRHPAKVEVRCARCGAPCQKRPDRHRPKQYCSLKCRTDDQYEGVREARAEREAMAQALRGNRELALTLRWRLAADKLAAGPRRTEWWQFFIAGRCSYCAAYFVAAAATLDTAAMYCSTRCARRRSRHVRRAREFGALVEVFNPVEIYERDHWTCKLCGRRVKRLAKVPDPKAPVVDHIVPLAAGPENGGVHASWNVQCAHFVCNSRKQASWSQGALF